MGKIKTTVMGKTILMPCRIVRVVREVLVPDEEKNRGLKEGEVRETKLVKQRLPANFQLGVVEATGVNNQQFKVGDTVAFKPNRVQLLELVKKAIVVDDFEIIGIWENGGDIEEEGEVNDKED